MPRILNQLNFSVSDLQNLYTKIAIKPFNDRHNANDNERNIITFFDREIEPYFITLFYTYANTESDYLEKSLSIIEEIRGVILDKLLIALNDSSTTALSSISYKIKSNLKQFITEADNKHLLQKMQYDCSICKNFRELINTILGPINHAHHTPLNINPLLGAWRFLDPANNRRGSIYCHNFFTYDTTGKLLLCNSSPEISYYGGIIIRAIAIYYLATKISFSGLPLEQEEQEARFGIYIDTLTEALRGYNEGNDQGIDEPSCPGGIISRLVIQCGYEPAIQFSSPKTIITNVISDVVCARINSILSTITTTDAVFKLLISLCPSFGDTQQLMQIQTTAELLQQRYCLFSTIGNNRAFFNEIVEQITLQQATNPTNHVILETYLNISRYTYGTFLDAVDTLTIDEPYSLLFWRDDFAKELLLIVYAFSDPIFSCYSNVLNMCLAKVQQLQSQFLLQTISSNVAMILAKEIIDELPTTAPNLLWNNGFNQVDLAIIIESYKNITYNNETDDNFLIRIVQTNYLDRDELGTPEQVNGLGNIINNDLPNRNKLINDIANKILEKIKLKLTAQRQGFNEYYSSTKQKALSTPFNTSSSPAIDNRPLAQRYGLI